LLPREVATVDQLVREDTNHGFNAKQVFPTLLFYLIQIKA